MLIQHKLHARQKWYTGLVRNNVNAGEAQSADIAEILNKITYLQLCADAAETIRMTEMLQRTFW